MTEDAARFPDVPADRLDGWTRTESLSETVFELSAVSVRGHTSIYEDRDLRTAVREASGGDLDRMWRFFFATRLVFSPPLPPGIGPSAVFSTVAARADTQFVDDLESRGFRDVSRGRGERIRVDSGDRARLRKYDARLDVDAPGERTVTLPVTGFLAVWTTDGDFRLGGGAYPARSLADALAMDVGDDRVATEPTTFREELLDLIRAVR
jgi:hypothetical protein